jgi:hypothetical protein
MVNTMTYNPAGGEGGAVNSVNGQTDVVVLDTDDIGEGSTNLYNVVPAGGTTGQVLEKVDGTDYNVQWAAGGGGSPGGSDTQIQYNDGGSFGGSSTLTFNGTNTLSFDAGGLVNTVLEINGSTNYRLVATSTDEFNIRDNTAGTNRISVASTGGVTFNEAYEMPIADGTSGQVLQTDGAGNVDWATASGGGGTGIASTFYDSTGGQTFNTTDSVVNIDGITAESNGTKITLASDEITLVDSGFYLCSFSVTVTPASGTRGDFTAKLQRDSRRQHRYNYLFNQFIHCQPQIPYCSFYQHCYSNGSSWC